MTHSRSRSAVMSASSADWPAAACTSSCRAASGSQRSAHASDATPYFGQGANTGCAEGSVSALTRGRRGRPRCAYTVSRWPLGVAPMSCRVGSRQYTRSTVHSALTSRSSYHGPDVSERGCACRTAVLVPRGRYRRRPSDPRAGSGDAGRPGGARPGRPPCAAPARSRAWALPAHAPAAPSGPHAPLPWANTGTARANGEPQCGRCGRTPRGRVRTSHDFNLGVTESVQLGQKGNVKVGRARVACAAA
jgi:hypothetical protein